MGHCLRQPAKTVPCYDKGGAKINEKKAVVKWISLATAVARRQVPANFAELFILLTLL